MRGFFMRDDMPHNDHINQIAEKAPEIMRAAGAASAGATGVISFIGNNASFFTVCFAFVGAAVAVVGHLWKRKIDRERRREERELHEIQMAAFRAKLDT